MADGVKVNEGVGPTVDTDELDRGDGTLVQRQRVQVGGTDGAEILTVTAGRANVSDVQAHGLLAAVRDAVDGLESLLTSPIASWKRRHARRG